MQPREESFLSDNVAVEGVEGGEGGMGRGNVGSRRERWPSQTRSVLVAAAVLRGSLSTLIPTMLYDWKALTFAVKCSISTKINMKVCIMSSEEICHSFKPKLK